MIRGLALALMFAPSLAAAQEPLSLSLVCTGRLAVMENQATSGRATNPYDATQAADVTTNSWRLSEIDARLSVILVGDTGRVRPGRRSTLGKRTADGGYAIETLQVGDDAISGQVAMGVIARSKLRIDRKTGDVRLGDFKGVCEKSTVAPEARKF